MVFSLVTHKTNDMKLKELLDDLQRQIEINPQRAEDEVVIAVKKSGGYAGVKPHVPITGTFAGFDWNRGLFFLNPENDLQQIEKEPWTEETEKKAQKLLKKLRAEPLAKEREEFGRMLFRHIDSFTPEERKRYEELKELLRKPLKPK